VVLPANAKISQLTLYRRDDSQQKAIATLKDDVYIFPPVPSGEYFVGLPIDTDLYLSDVSSGGKRTGYNTLRISGNQPVEKITLEFSRPGAEIKGILSNWGPHIQMVLLREDTGQVFTRPADDHGAFHFIGIPPARYRLYAWPQNETVPYRSPAFLKKHQEDGIGITVDSTSTYQADGLSFEHVGPVSN